MGVQIASDRRYQFASDLSSVWRGLADVPAYPTWWPWLVEFDGQLLRPGECWHCRIRSPLGIALRFDVRIAFVTERVRVGAVLHGDLEGAASVRLADRDQGAEVRLTSALAPHKRVLASVAAVAPWLGRRAHDRLLDTGARQFATAGAGLTTAGRPTP